MKILQKLLTELILIKALQSLPKGRKPFIDQYKGTTGDTDFMETFQFKIGARVMFIHNQDLMDDFFNDAGGTVIGVGYNKKRSIVSL